MFNEILHDPIVYKNAKFQKLQEFAKDATDRFFKHAQENPMIFVHALFKHTKHEMGELSNPGEKARLLADKAASREKRSRDALQKKIQKSLDQSANLSLAHQLSTELFERDENDASLNSRANPDPNLLIPDASPSDNDSDEPDFDPAQWTEINKELQAAKKTGSAARAANASHWTFEQVELLSQKYAAFHFFSILYFM